MTGVETDTGSIETDNRRQRRRHVRRRDRPPGGRDGAGRPDGPRVPDHEAARRAARRADDARSVAARLLPGRVRRPRDGRLRAPAGAVGARRHSSRLQRQAARRGLAALRGADGERRRPRSGARRRRGGTSSSTAPRRSRPTASSSSGRRPCAASGWPPASARTASPAPAGWGKLVAEWIVEGIPSLDVWEMDSRRFGAHYANLDYTLARTIEVYSTYYDVKYPGHERQAGRPLKLSPTYPRLQELGAAFGEKSGWERANWFEPNARGGRRVAAPAWLGGTAVVSGDRRRAPRLPRGGGALRRDELREDRGVGRGRGRRSSSGCARTVSPATSARSRTRRCSTRAAASSATSRSRGSRRIAFASSPARPSASTTSRGSGSTRPTTARSPSTDVTADYACLGLWGPAARVILASGHDRRPLVRLHALWRDRRGEVSTASRSA